MSIDSWRTLPPSPEELEVIRVIRSARHHRLNGNRGLMKAMLLKSIDLMDMYVHKDRGT